MSKELVLKIALAAGCEYWQDGTITYNDCDIGELLETVMYRYHAAMMEKYGKGFEEARKALIGEGQYFNIVAALAQDFYQAGAASREQELQGLRETLNVISELCDTLREEVKTADAERIACGKEVDRLWGQIDATREALAEAQKDAERLKTLRNLCGHIEDGSSQVIQLSQDDATGEWVLSIGGSIPRTKQWYGRSFSAAIDAVRKEGE